MNPTRRSLLCAAALLPLPALALNRGFPKNAVRGHILFVQDREVVVNGVREKLPLGVQIRDERARPPQRGSLDGKTFTANYVRDSQGFIRKIWLLSPQEIQRPLLMDATILKREREQSQRMNNLYNMN